MNTPIDHESEDLRFAEYVLGVLDSAARAAVEHEIERDPRAAAEVARWQRHLAPLADEIAPVTTPDYLWTRINRSLQADDVSHRSAAIRTRRSLWSSLALWRTWAAAASVVAVAVILAFALVPRMGVVSSPASVTNAYMASTLKQTSGQVGWTATMDVRHARMVIVPVNPQTLPAGRAAELWLIPAGHKPIAVGMVATHAPTTLALNRELAAQLGPKAALAVSVEPPGGSPTGQPTGPVIATGAIAAATADATQPIAMNLSQSRQPSSPDA